MPNQGKKSWKKTGGLLAFLALISGKLKFLLPFLKFGKLGPTIWSIALSIGGYLLIYPWSVAIGLVAMIFIHEMGHVWAARIKKLPVSAPAFIPFMGALITMKKQPQDAATEAFIAIGGPLLGTIGAVAALALGVLTGYEALFAIAMIGFFINLINLLPIHPLDGGRIVTAISRWLWLVGLIGGVIFIIYLRSILFFFFWCFFAWELYSSYVKRRKAARGDRSGISAGAREEHVVLEVPVSYFEEHGVFVPAMEHQRTLPFVQVGDIVQKQEQLMIGYPGLDILRQIPFTKGLVNHVWLLRTERMPEMVRMILQISYEPYLEYQGMVKEEAYYKVSIGQRFAYGFTYFGLAALLLCLMYYTSLLTPQTTM
ncbi:site-2 protease family protein [Aneurinibacillus terranovensis]|uniref:site-2 protease family protein n=1 Tax=Aneurinibacillus terranovensis TaxID=278991 RepID=UPI00041E7615|nr:site-2 protease family protein [Aneurinibacillus terranovensis]